LLSRASALAETLQAAKPTSTPPALASASAAAISVVLTRLRLLILILLQPLPLLLLAREADAEDAILHTRLGVADLGVSGHSIRAVDAATAAGLATDVEHEAVSELVGLDGHLDLGGGEARHVDGEIGVLGEGGVDGEIDWAGDGGSLLGHGDGKKAVDAAGSDGVGGKVSGRGKVHFAVESGTGADVHGVGTSLTNADSTVVLARRGKGGSEGVAVLADLRGNAGGGRLEGGQHASERVLERLVQRVLFTQAWLQVGVQSKRCSATQREHCALLRSPPVWTFTLLDTLT
jgi:hypothetical protein